MLLANHLVEGAGSHAHSQRRGCRDFRRSLRAVIVVGLRRGEQILHVSTLILLRVGRIEPATLGDMRAVIQVVSSASVSVENQIVGQLPRPGLMILLGVHVDDTEEQADALVNKIVNLRILEDEQSALDVQAPALVVSQFTLYADVRKGRRPSWSKAARPEQSEPLYEYFVDQLRQQGLEVATGQFGAMMDVSLVNTGPFTIVVDSDELAAPRRG